MIDFLAACFGVVIFLLIVSRRGAARVHFLKESREHPRIVMLTCLTALALFPLDMQDIWSVFIPAPALKWVLVAASYLGFSLLLTCLGLWLRTLLNSSSLQPTPWQARETNVFLVTLTGCLLYLGLYACLFGFSATIDFSVTQCRQMATGEYSRIHPVVHTLLCEGLLSLWNNHAVIAVFQSLCFSIACAFYVDFCRWSGLPRWWAALSTAVPLICLSPFVLCLNKDVLFVAGVMLLTTGLSWIVLSWGQRGLWVTGAGLLLAGTMRFDGLLVALVAGTGLLFFSIKYRMARRSVIITCATTCVLTLFCVVAVPRLVHANNHKTGTKYAKPAFVLACLRAENPDMRHELKTGIDTYILPWDFNCRQYSQIGGGGAVYRNGEVYIWDFLFLDQKDKPYSFCYSLKDENRTVYWRLFSAAARDYPWQTAKILILNAQLIWNCRPLFVASCAFWLFLSAAASCFLARTTHRMGNLLPALPLFTAAFAIAAAATTWELRYSYAPLAAAPLFLGYAFACSHRKRKEFADASPERGCATMLQRGNSSGFNSTLRPS